MKRQNNFDYLFFFAVLFLSAIGVIMVFSASPTMAIKFGDTFYFLKRQFLYISIGALLLYYGYCLDLESLKTKAFPIFAVSILFLVLVFIPGIGRNVLGASRWIDLGIFSFQPTELSKFAVVLLLAKYFSDIKGEAKDFSKGILFPLLIFGIIAALIMKQPDLGSVLTIGGSFFVMLLIAGTDLRHLSMLGGAGVLAVLALSITSAYRLRRLLAYLDPWKDPQGIGFHIIQSLLAVGSGGFFGLGLGGSRQKFFYLPQQSTDFIFAILCEELGFIGGCGVVLLFAVFVFRGFRIAALASDSFRCYLSSGLVAWISIQAVINIMVVLGIVPTTGIPLPFISYGGTATIMNLFAVGIILNISKKPK